MLLLRRMLLTGRRVSRAATENVTRLQGRHHYVFAETSLVPTLPHTATLSVILAGDDE